MSKKKDLQQEKRERYLTALINEGIINVLAEQELDMQPPGSPVPPAAPTPSPETNVMDPSVQQAAQPPVEEEPFTVDSMVEKLNTLRGGRSYTDPEIYGKLTTFFNNLTDEQRQSLEWVLNELGQIVVDVESNTPDENGQEQQTSQQQTQAPPPPPPAPAPQGGGTPPPASPAAPVTPVS